MSTIEQVAFRIHEAYKKYTNFIELIFITNGTRIQNKHIFLFVLEKMLWPLLFIFCEMKSQSNISKDLSKTKCEITKQQRVETDYLSRAVAWASHISEDLLFLQAT